MPKERRNLIEYSNQRIRKEIRNCRKRIILSEERIQRLTELETDSKHNQGIKSNIKTMLIENIKLLNARKEEIKMWKSIISIKADARKDYLLENKSIISNTKIAFKVINKIELDFQKHCKFNLGRYRHWNGEFCKFCNFNGNKKLNQ